jgi:hypothetical protein
VTQVLESADAAYTLAVRYGPPRKALLAARQALVKSILRRAHITRFDRPSS